VLKYHIVKKIFNVYDTKRKLIRQREKEIESVNMITRKYVKSIKKKGSTYDLRAQRYCAW
jgi:hypothetical protein